MLTGWKSIAKFLNVSIRTAKNWYYYSGMPVYKTKTGRPCCDRLELKRWIKENG
jgi:hypothetical protein